MSASGMPIGLIQAQSVIDVPPQPAPLGIGYDEVLNLFADGYLPDTFRAEPGSVLNVYGGSVPYGFRAGDNSLYSPLASSLGGKPPQPLPIVDPVTVNLVGGDIGDAFSLRRGATLNVTGGRLGDHGNAEFESVVNMSGGAIGRFFQLDFGATMNLSGGSIDDYFGTNQGTTLHISGGEVGDNFVARGDLTITAGSIGQGFFSDGNVTISGGQFGEPFAIGIGASVKLIGSEFLLDGLPIDGLVAGGPPVVIEQRDVILSATLLDGSHRLFDLSSDSYSTTDYFSPDATLTLTLVSVPEPGGMALWVAAALLLTLGRRRRPSC